LRKSLPFKGTLMQASLTCLNLIIRWCSGLHVDLVVPVRIQYLQF